MYVLSPARGASPPTPAAPATVVSSAGRALRVVAVAVAVATAVVVGRLWIEQRAPDDVVHRIEEVRVPLSGGHGASLPLALQLSHHEGASATLRVEVPAGVRVLPAGGVRPGKPPSCDVKRCVHSFDVPAAAAGAGPHLRVEFPASGRFRVFVEHDSSERSVREVLLVVVE